MRKTNSKEAIEAIKNAIIESYEAAEEYYTYGGKEAKSDYNDICKDILKAFYSEKCELDNRYIAGRISKQDLFIEWMSGLPGSFPISDDIFLQSGADWIAKILDQTDSEKEKYTDFQAEKLACKLLYRELSKHADKSK